MDMCRLQKWLLNVASAHCQWGRQRIGMVVGESKRAGHTVTRDSTILKQAVSALLRVFCSIDKGVRVVTRPYELDLSAAPERFLSSDPAETLRKGLWQRVTYEKISILPHRPERKCSRNQRKNDNGDESEEDEEIGKAERNRPGTAPELQGDLVQTIKELNEQKNVYLVWASAVATRQNSDTHIMRQVLPTIYGLEDKLDSRWSEVYLVRRARIRTWIYSSDLRGSRHIISDLRGDGWDYVRPEE
ncbi:hypothetical protein C8R45DRAFT_944687 [Mycena sanguinolenta]|nr:hypothetical protein C8R45DRAFT_944687 [Mycena sanguinolenta]